MWLHEQVKDARSTSDSARLHAITQESIYLYNTAVRPGTAQISAAWARALTK